MLILSVLLITSCGYDAGIKLTFDVEGDYDYTDKEAVSEDVYITATGVILSNMVINSDLYIDESVGDGHIELHNVEVNGTVHVHGGGLETIFIQDGKILKLIGYVDGRIEAAGDTKIDEVIVKEPGMILENHEEAKDAYNDVTIEIDDPSEEDEPVVLDGDFGEVEAKEGSNVVIEEETVVRHYYLTCGNYEGPGYYTTRTKVKKDARVEKMDIDGDSKIDNEGEIVEKTYGENYQGNEPAILNATMSVNSSGDYSIDFKTNTEGTIYYMVQPGFDSTGVTRTPEQVVKKEAYEFQMELAPGEEPGDLFYLASGKSVRVSEPDLRITATGYMGDAFGQRPPNESGIKFDSVIWYVIKDSEGNFSDVGKLIYQ